MFGRNEIVGRKNFPSDDELLVTSYFVTLQGEGPYSGLPAVFVRLAKCNLACSFCDTYFDSGDWMTFDELDTRLNDEVWDSPLDKKDYVLVITGGEPMLQQALPLWLNRQLEDWKAIQIESNGTSYQVMSNHVTLVVSPKCAEKNGKPTKYLRPNIKMLECANHLKFVMDSDPTSPYYEIPDWALEWKRTRVNKDKQIFVSPMNVYNRAPAKAKTARNSNSTTVEDRSKIEEVISFWEPGLLDLKANERNHLHAAQYAMKHGLRFQVQAHLYAGLA